MATVLAHAREIKQLFNDSFPDSEELAEQVENWRNIILYYLKAEQENAAKIYLEDMAKTLVYVRMMIRGDDVSEELDGVQFYRAPLPAGFTFMNLTPPVHPDEVLMKAEIKQCVNFMLRFKRLHAHWSAFFSSMRHVLC